MSDFKSNMGCKIDKHPLWDRLEDNYNKYFLNPKDKTVAIPKKIHQIWLGGEFPDKYKRLRDTWINKNPSWEYRLWTDDDADKYGMINDKAFRTVKNYGARSDIFRYEILYREGGVYVDTDFECVKSFDDFSHLSFYGGVERQSKPFTFNGLIGCVPRHEIILDVISAIKDKDVQAEYGWGDIMALTGPDLFSELVMKYVAKNKDATIVFPTNFFYPMPNNFRLEIRNDTEANRNRIYGYIQPNTYAIHLWYTSWQSYRFIVDKKPRYISNTSLESQKEYVCECGTKWLLTPEITKTCPKCLMGMRWTALNKRKQMAMIVKKHNKQRRHGGEWELIN